MADGADSPDAAWLGMVHERPDLGQACRMILDFLHSNEVVSEAVAQGAGVTQARIEQTFQRWMSSGRCSEAAQRLEDLGLIVRHRVDRDTYVFLTSAGTGFAREVAEQQVYSAAIQGTALSGNATAITVDEHGKPV
jgi:DNA-binding MarR family transcriptional regulator